MKIIFLALAGLSVNVASNFVDSDRLLQASTMTKTTQTQLNENYPPFISASETATPVIVTVELMAKDPVELEQHLKSPNVIPTTRLASGINYSWTVRDTANPNHFVLIQQWNSAAQQQGYIEWREARGDLARLRQLLSKDLIVNYLAPMDLNTLPAQAK